MQHFCSIVIFFILWCYLFDLFGEILIILGVNFTILVINRLKNWSDMVIPLERCICHTKVHLSLFLHVSIIRLLGDFHSSIEMLCTGVVITLWGKNLSKLHVSPTFTLTILKFIGQLKISFNEHLHFVLIHLGINFIASNFSQVTNSNGLSSDRTHLDSIPKSELVINRWFFVVADHVVNDTKINMS